MSDVTVTVTVDQARCCGHGRCNAVAPSLFPLDVSGYVDVAELTLTKSADVAAARSAATECPESVIEVRERKPAD